MADRNEIEHLVERTVSQVMQGHFTQMRDELVRRVIDELPRDLTSSGGAESTGTSPSDLLREVSTVHAGTTQKEILRALLDGVSHHSGRTALFVIKGGSCSGWQGRGFEDNDSVKEFPLNTTRGLPERVLQERAAFTGQIIDMDPRFVDQFGSPADEQILMLPLLLKDKVAALVYADNGLDASRHVDTASIELLVVATSAWLELISARKQAPREAGTYSDAPPAAPTTQTVSNFNDPFAAHAPRHSGAAAAAPAYEPQAVAQADVVSAAQAGDIAKSPAAGLSEEDAETHRKAQRFARLLVDEIKLYNQAKVAEGRKNKDLYDRLKEDIDKSRSTYRKRYGNTVAASTDYFQVELVRSLAEDDISIMGANFRR